MDLIPPGSVRFQCPCGFREWFLPGEDPVVECPCCGTKYPSVKYCLAEGILIKYTGPEQLLEPLIYDL